MRNQVLIIASTLLLLFLTVSGFCLPDFSNTRSWNITVVDSSHLPCGVNSMTDHSLRLDSSGYPHLAYGGIRLYYARKVGTNWIVQEIDNRRASEASLALDRNDYPHISYVSDSKLQYIHWNGAQWIKETVDDRYSRYTSIALDSSDHPQISYCGVEGLMLARRNNSGWIITSVGLSCGQSNSLALDSNSYAHISCDCAGQPMYVHWTGTGWSSETLPHTLLAGSFTSIALDDDDHPHITYYDQRFDIFDLGGLVYNLAT